ncbi:tyrosine-type recombinase/integrase [Candidatus Bathyarchaeota archaeon]|nr:tyrosine-type recombinase/integrase [Candidatus Bathyarchaeota archaeon]
MACLSYLEQYQSHSTRKNSTSSLREFFKSIYGEASDLEGLAQRYFSEGRDYKKDMEGFFISLNGRPPKTIKLRMSNIRTFLSENNVELEAKFWRRLTGRIKGNRALTLDRIPTPQQLKEIMHHLPVQGKALFLVLASSGMRIGEALQLTVNDVELDKDPAVVRIRGDYTKSGNSRIAFISKEAKESLQEYLKIRDKAIEASEKRGRKPKGGC